MESHRYALMTSISEENTLVDNLEMLPNVLVKNEIYDNAHWTYIQYLNNNLLNTQVVFVGRLNYAKIIGKGIFCILEGNGCTVSVCVWDNKRMIKNILAIPINSSVYVLGKVVSILDYEICNTTQTIQINATDIRV